MSLDQSFTDVDEKDLFRQTKNASQQSDLLRVPVSWVDGVAVLSPMGEIDIATKPLLDERLTEVVPNLVAGLVVDLSQVTFLDSSGLCFLVTTDKRISDAGGHFVVYAPTRQIRRLFDISGLTSYLTIVPESAPDEDWTSRA